MAHCKITTTICLSDRRKFIASKKLKSIFLQIANHGLSKMNLWMNFHWAFLLNISQYLSDYANSMKYNMDFYFTKLFYMTMTKPNLQKELSCRYFWNFLLIYYYRLKGLQNGTWKPIWGKKKYPHFCFTRLYWIMSFLKY